MATTDSTPARSPIEQRSIDYIPARERHGRPWHCTTVWFMCTTNVTVLALGTVGPLLGLSLLWSVVAIVGGSLFGTIFAALHSSQGPEMGLPQMIQSRPQFGYKGAVLIYLIAVLAYIGTTVLAISLMGTALTSLVDISPELGMVLVTLLGIAVAVYGYDLIHRTSRYSSAFLLAAFLVLTVGALSRLGDGAALSDGAGWSTGAFMAQFIAMASGTLAWAPYVSDYTRYLPKEGGILRSFLATYLGMALSAIWMSALAAVIINQFPSTDIVDSFRRAADHMVSGFGTVIVLVSSSGTVIVVAMSLYGGALTLLSGVTSLVDLRATARLRIQATVLLGAICLPIAIAISNDFQDFLGFYFAALIYLLAPWTAINLVDFFFVRRGHYSITEIFNPKGIYGSWNWQGYSVYAITIAAMYPFMLTPYFSGPVGERLGYDLAPFIGVAVAGLAYLLMTRDLDLEAERRIIEAADADLESRTTQQPDDQMSR
ncbi:cytosine permease [Nocardioides sp. L-11A]|uniref:purine-cytosine permease family protein n=1 Tax=Nocardioides sp. L-11A TaxID=3043848 RepID=UPI002499B274|nr:cytosine permease [Nocardioides sp. L-11A]